MEHLRLKDRCEKRRRIRFWGFSRTVIEPLPSTHTQHHHQQQTTSNILQRALSFRCLPTVCGTFFFFFPSRFMAYRSSSASALFAFGIGYFETLLWCDKHTNCVLNNSTEWWGRSVFNVFSASLSLAISVDVQQRERHVARTTLSNQDSALLYVTSSVASGLKHTTCEGAFTHPGQGGDWDLL